MNRTSKLLTTAEAASLIGCSVQHVRTLIRQGRLPAEKIKLTYGYTYGISRKAATQYRDAPTNGRGYPRGKKRSKPQPTNPFPFLVSALGANDHE